MRWERPQSRFSQFLLLALLGVAICLSGCGPSATVEAAVIIITATPSQTPDYTNTPTITATAPLPPTFTPTVTLTPTPTCAEDHGTMTRATLGSLALENQPIPYRLYLPPCYESHTWQRYPVLYLIHGLNMTERAWDELGADELADELITSGEVPPFIMVMPRAPDDARFTETMVFDLVPFIDKEYRTFPDRQFRSLGGMSRGGGWTVRIGLQYPDVFSSLGLHSLAIFFADENKVVGWLNRLPDDKLPRIYMDIGQSDSLMESATWFDEALTARFIDHQFIIRPGRHEDAYWKEHLEEYLRWYTENW
jgi:enterochelin esterase-like enzyme